MHGKQDYQQWLVMIVICRFQCVILPVAGGGTNRRGLLSSCSASELLRGIC